MTGWRRAVWSGAAVKEAEFILIIIDPLKLIN